MKRTGIKVKEKQTATTWFLAWTSNRVNTNWHTATHIQTHTHSHARDRIRKEANTENKNKNKMFKYSYKNRPLSAPFVTLAVCHFFVVVVVVAHTAFPVLLCAGRVPCDVSWPCCCRCHSWWICFRFSCCCCYCVFGVFVRNLLLRQVLVHTKILHEK